MTHFSQQDNFSVAARVLGALFYYAPESAEAAPLVAVLTSDGWETQWPLPKRTGRSFWFTAVDGCVVGGEWSPDRMRRIAGMAPFSVVNTFS